MMDQQLADSTPGPGRMTTIILTSIIALAIVGYFVGTVGNRRRVAPEPLASPTGADPSVGIPATPESPDASGAVPSAVSYADMTRIRLGPNRDLVTTLAAVDPPEVDLSEIDPPDPALKAAALTDRASRRAFNGAPPVIPHSIDQRSTASCMACHEHALRVGDVAAGRIPHPYLASCTQCHVEQTSADLPALELAGNAFAGLPAPFEGPRAGPGAPPLVPHSTLMRTDCLSCHGPLGPAGLRTTHPGRQACLQCHAPSAVLDQYAATGKPALLPGPMVRSP